MLRRGLLASTVLDSVFSESFTTQFTQAIVKRYPVQPEANVAGYFDAELGVGQAARGVLRALTNAGVRCTTFTNRRTLSRRNHPFHGVKEASNPALNVVCVNADAMSSFAHTVGPRFFRGRYTVGVWAWELESFPRQHWNGFDYVDEIWAGSRFAAEAIQKSTTKPVEVFNLPVVEPQPQYLSRGELGLPEDAFVFLFSYDFFSSAERKNPLGLIAAYSDAFGSRDRAVLVLKSINGHARSEHLAAVVEAACGRPDILVRDEYLDSDLQGSLMAHCDAYVSLHRSEGFGLTLAEAMRLGKPVIATRYSGNLDFMDDSNSYLVNFEPGVVQDPDGPYPVGFTWAEPNLEHASYLMREVYTNREAALNRGKKAAQDIERQLGLTARAEVMQELLENISRRRLSTDLVADRIGRNLTRDRTKGLWRVTKRRSKQFMHSVDSRLRREANARLRE